MAKASTEPKPSQVERFRETARELGCGEDEAAFRDKLRVIARQKPKGEPASSPRCPKGKP